MIEAGENPNPDAKVAEPSVLSQEIANIKAELAIADAEAEAAAFEELTPRRQAFVREYLIDLNGTQAAIRAGFSRKTAGKIAIEYLQIPAIAAAVERGQAERLARCNLRAETILQEMAALALSNIEHYKISDEGEVSVVPGAPRNAMAAVAAVDKTTIEKVDPKSGEITRTYNVKLKLWPKVDPLKMLGKHAGIAAFVDRLEVTGKDGGPIEIAATRLAELPIEALKQKMLELAEQAPIEAEFTEQPAMERAS